MVKKIKKTTGKVYHHVPICPTPWVNNREKRMIKFEEDLKECKKQWTVELENSKFDMGTWNISHYKNENDLGLLVEIMKEKIDNQRKELKKIEKSQRRMFEIMKEKIDNQRKELKKIKKSQRRM